MAKLNQKQSDIKLKVLDGKNAFITGFAGSGKSYLIEHICESLILNGKKYALTAMTGCAALLINGRTLHSTIGIGLGKGSPKDLIKKIKLKIGLFDYLLSLDVLIIDEVSMLNDILFDTIAEIFKIIHKSDKPFGNLQIILVGDMSQLKPIEGEYCFYANCWDACNIEVSILTENMRVNSDEPFHNLLQELRWGKINDLSLIEKMKLTVFTGDIKPTKLFSKNKDVETTNNYELDLLLNAGNESNNYKIIYPRDIIKLKESKKYISDNKISEFVNICVDSQVMVTRNLEPGIVNGTRGIVVSLNKNSVTIKLVNGKNYCITYFHIKPEFGDTSTTNLDFKYLPLMLSWAISIHKSQGATIDLLEIDIGDSIFACGQAYVAISRARNSDSVKITEFNKKSIKVSKSVIQFYDKYK